MGIIIISAILYLISGYYYVHISEYIQLLPLWLNWGFKIGYFSVPLIIPYVIGQGRKQSDHSRYMLLWKVFTRLVALTIAVFGSMIVSSLVFLMGDFFALIHHLILSHVWEDITISLKLIDEIALGLGALFFLGISYAVLLGRFHYQTKKEVLYFDKLPKAFDGYKVLQFSDLHIGSFWSHQSKIKKVIEKMNSEQADLIVFTGDLVNNLALEFGPFVKYFKELKAPDGVMSVLGNHDYAEYIPFKYPDERKKNMEQLKAFQKEAGFRLLMNEHVELKRGLASLYVLGVENWGAPPFPAHGDLQKAAEGIPSSEFKLLLSHDPSHWSHKVVKESNVDLTLSGHTHGMQFGLRLGNFKWSLVKWKYPNWAGVYRKGEQVLYVSTGLGHIAFPGRLGIRPEYTIIELRCN